MQILCSVQDAEALIREGGPLLLAGDEAVLKKLPKGNWIGGTIPYFMTPDGGINSRTQIFVTSFSDAFTATIRNYDTETLAYISEDYPAHGFTILLIPGFSEVHETFAQNVPNFTGIFDSPLLGWVAGVAVSDIGKISPKVYNGLTGASSVCNAVALHVAIPTSQQASVDIINLFVPGNGPEIVFPSASFSAEDVLIGGVKSSFSRYISEHGIDTKLPLVADYHGAMVNVSICSVDDAKQHVSFYAPVFPGVPYRFAAPVIDYPKAFLAEMGAEGPPFQYSYNCILNYLYAGLEGHSTGRLIGPMTFGEIAYMLLNQTAVYLTVE